MKLLITGATGFVGKEVARYANQAGHVLRVLVRHPESPAVNELSSLCHPEISPGDVLDPASLQRAVDGVDAIIHLVGIISEVRESTFENVHTRATKNLIAAAQRAGVARFVHMSALGTRPEARSRYHQTKWQAEQALRQSHLGFTVFRPSLIYGPEDQFVNLFARLAQFSPVLPVLGNPRARFQPVSVQAVARAFVRALNEPASIGQTYDLCGPEILTFPEILDQICSVTRRKRLKLHVPMPLAWLQAALLEILFSSILGKAPPLNRDQLKMLQEDNVGQGLPADELFELEHESFRQGIEKYLSD